MIEERQLLVVGWHINAGDSIGKTNKQTKKGVDSCWTALTLLLWWTGNRSVGVVYNCCGKRTGRQRDEHDEKGDDASMSPEEATSGPGGIRRDHVRLSLLLLG